jgi:MFS family permease
MAAWTLRYVFFAAGDAGDRLWMLLLGIALHGVCYDFFFVAGQVYTDARAGETARASAQGLVTLATYGLGMLAGFYIAGLVTDAWRSPAGHDWAPVWLVPAGLAAVVFVVFALLFRGTASSPAEVRP